jgi:hypothetical protein
MNSLVYSPQFSEQIYSPQYSGQIYQPRYNGQISPVRYYRDTTPTSIITTVEELRVIPSRRVKYVDTNSLSFYKI